MNESDCTGIRKPEVMPPLSPFNPFSDSVYGQVAPYTGELPMPPDHRMPPSPELMPRMISRRWAVGGILTAASAGMSSGATKAPETTHLIIDASALGVRADGVTDDAPALARAVAAMSSGSVLVLPAGTIALGSTGWPGITVHGLSNICIQGNQTMLKWLAEPSLATSAFGPSGLRLFECVGAVIRDLAIDGNQINCVGLTLDACSSCVVRNVEAFAHGVPSRRSSSGQFASTKGNRNTWQFCMARDATPGSETRGFYLGNANRGLGETDLRIDGCVARRNTATGFAIEAVRMLCTNCISEANLGAGFTSSTADGSPSTDHIFEGNVARLNAFHGWQTDVYGGNAERIILLGNDLSENAISGVYCHRGTTITITGNMLVRNGRNVGAAAISLSMSSQVIVNGNQIDNDAAKGACIGFEFTGNQVSDVVIAGNILRGSTGNLVSIETTDAATRLQRILINDNILNGRGVGIRVATLTDGGHIDAVSITNNVIDPVGPAGCVITGHAGAQITNLRCSGNSGPRPAIDGNVALFNERGTSSNVPEATSVAPPTQGTWPTGAIVYNSAPRLGTPVGWVCTAGGTPGTWNGFGLIGAAV